MTLAAVNKFRPGVAGLSAIGMAPKNNVASGSGNAFAATLNNFLAKSESGKKTQDKSDNSGPLQALTQLLQKSTLGTQIGLGGLQNVGELRTETTQLQTQFQSGFRKMLSDQGIDLGAGVSLQVDARGDIRVTNDHPDKLFIESALKNEPELSKQFRQLSANSSLLHAAELSQDFQQAYGIDPQKAMTEYQQSFGKQAQQVFRLTITSDGAQQTFTDLQADTSAAIL